LSGFYKFSLSFLKNIPINSGIISLHLNKGGYWILDAGCWILDAGYWMLDAGCLKLKINWINNCISI